MLTNVAYEEFRSASLFHDLPDEVLDELAQRSRLIELHAGENLFLQDDPSDATHPVRNRPGRHQL